MYVLIVEYTKSEEQVAKVRAAHAAWVSKYVSAGTLLIAGPSKDKTGGVLLAKAIDIAKINAIVAEDPYVTENVAQYRIIDFDAKAFAQGLEFLQAA